MTSDRRRSTAFLAVAVLLAASCGSATDDGPGDDVAVETPGADPSPTPVATAPPIEPDEGPPAAALTGPVEYARSGGIAGIVEVLVIEADGSYTIESSVYGDGSGVLLGDVYLEVVAAVGIPGALDTDQDFEPPEGTADAIYGSITYQGVTASTADGASPTEPVTQLFRVFDAVFSDLGAQAAALTVAQAAALEDGSAVLVSGALLIDVDGEVRLCDGLAESFPPQCPSGFLVVRGLDLDVLPDLDEASGVRWTEQVVLDGVVEGGALVID